MAGCSKTAVFVIFLFICGSHSAVPSLPVENYELPLKAAVHVISQSLDGRLQLPTLHLLKQDIDETTPSNSISSKSKLDIHNQNTEGQDTVDDLKENKVNILTTENELQISLDKEASDKSGTDVKNKNLISGKPSKESNERNSDVILGISDNSKINKDESNIHFTVDGQNQNEDTRTQTSVAKQNHRNTFEIGDNPVEENQTTEISEIQNLTEEYQSDISYIETTTNLPHRYKAKYHYINTRKTDNPIEEYQTTNAGPEITTRIPHQYRAKYQYSRKPAQTYFTSVEENLSTKSTVETTSTTPHNYKAKYHYRPKPHTSSPYLNNLGNPTEPVVETTSISPHTYKAKYHYTRKPTSSSHLTKLDNAVEEKTPTDSIVETTSTSPHGYKPKYRYTRKSTKNPHLKKNTNVEEYQSTESSVEIISTSTHQYKSKYHFTRNPNNKYPSTPTDERLDEYQSTDSVVLETTTKSPHRYKAKYHYTRKPSNSPRRMSTNNTLKHVSPETLVNIDNELDVSPNKTNSENHYTDNDNNGSRFNKFQPSSKRRYQKHSKPITNHEIDLNDSTNVKPNESESDSTKGKVDDSTYEREESSEVSTSIPTTRVHRFRPTRKQYHYNNLKETTIKNKFDEIETTTKLISTSRGYHGFRPSRKPLNIKQTKKTESNTVSHVQDDETNIATTEIPTTTRTFNKYRKQIYTRHQPTSFKKEYTTLSTEKSLDTKDLQDASETTIELPTTKRMYQTNTQTRRYSFNKHPLSLRNKLEKASSNFTANEETNMLPNSDSLDRSSSNLDTNQQGNDDSTEEVPTSTTVYQRFRNPRPRMHFIPTTEKNVNISFVNTNSDTPINRYNIFNRPRPHMSLKPGKNNLKNNEHLVSKSDDQVSDIVENTTTEDTTSTIKSFYNNRFRRPQPHMRLNTKPTTNDKSIGTDIKHHNHKTDEESIESTSIMVSDGPTYIYMKQNLTPNMKNIQDSDIDSKQNTYSETQDNSATEPSTTNIYDRFRKRIHISPHSSVKSATTEGSLEPNLETSQGNVDTANFGYENMIINQSHSNTGLNTLSETVGNRYGENGEKYTEDLTKSLILDSSIVLESSLAETGTNKIEQKRYIDGSQMNGENNIYENRRRTLMTENRRRPKHMRPRLPVHLDEDNSQRGLDIYPAIENGEKRNDSSSNLRRRPIHIRIRKPVYVAENILEDVEVEHVTEDASKAEEIRTNENRRMPRPSENHRRPIHIRPSKTMYASKNNSSSDEIHDQGKADKSIENFSHEEVDEIKSNERRGRIYISENRRRPIHMRPRNLIHLAEDNFSSESTANQTNSSFQTNAEYGNYNKKISKDNLYPRKIYMNPDNNSGYISDSHEAIRQTRFANYMDFEDGDRNLPFLKRKSRDNSSFETFKDIEDSTKKVLEGEKHSETKEIDTLFSENDDVDDLFFEEADPDEEDLFFDINNLGFSSTDSPAEKVTVSLPRSFTLEENNDTSNEFNRNNNKFVYEKQNITAESEIDDNESVGLAKKEELVHMQEYIDDRMSGLLTEMVVADFGNQNAINTNKSLLENKIDEELSKDHNESKTDDGIILDIPKLELNTKDEHIETNISNFNTNDTNQILESPKFLFEEHVNNLTDEIRENVKNMINSVKDSTMMNRNYNHMNEPKQNRKINVENREDTLEQKAENELNKENTEEHLSSDKETELSKNNKDVLGDYDFVTESDSSTLITTENTKDSVKIIPFTPVYGEDEDTKFMLILQPSSNLNEKDNEEITETTSLSNIQKLDNNNSNKTVVNSKENEGSANTMSNNLMSLTTNNSISVTEKPSETKIENPETQTNISLNLNNEVNISEYLAENSTHTMKAHKNHENIESNRTVIDNVKDNQELDTFVNVNSSSDFRNKVDSKLDEHEKVADIIIQTDSVTINEPKKDDPEKKTTEKYISSNQDLNKTSSNQKEVDIHNILKIINENISKEDSMEKINNKPLEGKFINETNSNKSNVNFEKKDIIRNGNDSLINEIPHNETHIQIIPPRNRKIINETGQINDIRPIILGNVLGKPFNLSIEVKIKNDTINIPSDAIIIEELDNWHNYILNVTWYPIQDTNSTISLNLTKKESKYYEINSIQLFLVKDGDVSVWSKNVTSQPKTDENNLAFILEMESDVLIIFSNVNFLAIDDDEDNLEDIESAASEDKATRITNVEIALGIVLVICLMVVTIYCVVRKMRIRSIKKNNKVPTS